MRVFIPRPNRLIEDNKEKVEKTAKLVMETLMASGIGLEDLRFPKEEDPEKDLKYTASRLHQGLKQKLSTAHGMKKVSGRWEPKSVEELENEM